MRKTFCTWDLSVLVCHCSAVTSPPAPICSRYQGRSPGCGSQLAPVLQCWSCTRGMQPRVSSWHLDFHSPSPVGWGVQSSPYRAVPEKLRRALWFLPEWEALEPAQAAEGAEGCPWSGSRATSLSHEVFHRSICCGGNHPSLFPETNKPRKSGETPSREFHKRGELSRACLRSLADRAQQAPGCSASPPKQAGQSPGTWRFVLLAGAGPAPSQAPATHSDMSESLCSPQSHLGGKHWL